MTYVRIVPLGGLGEVGMNCLALETPDGILVIDCGVTFPHGEPGVDIIHPDFAYLWERRQDVLGVVITHGHEDHIGALPYLLRRIPVPVWAPPYAAALIRHRLGEHPEVPIPDLRVTTPRQRFKVGTFTVEPLRVTHSIPDATALCIETPAGRIVHTGDFKLDADPTDGEPSDENRFRELGDEGVALLLSDSTNIDVPGRAGRERDVAVVLRNVIGNATGRVVVGAFASNIFRLQALTDVATATGRHIVLLGRSVQQHVRAAMDLGRLRVRSDVIVSPDHAMDLPRHKVLAVASGTQAEPNSALAKLARHEHPKMKITHGDTVVFSSRAIPGNEREVFDLVCALERLGADVHFRSTEVEIHASGHAGRDEQTQMLGMVQPRSFIPVHGTFHHLKRHAELAQGMGVDNVLVIENGQTARWSGTKLARTDAVTHGRVHIDHGVPLDTDTLEQRVELADAGVVFVSIQVDSRGDVIGTPEISERAAVDLDAPEALRAAATVAIDEAITRARGALDVLAGPALREAVRGAIRRVYRAGTKRPHVVVHVRHLEGGSDDIDD